MEPIGRHYHFDQGILATFAGIQIHDLGDFVGPINDVGLEPA
jgi:hypothetical protein